MMLDFVFVSFVSLVPLVPQLPLVPLVSLVPVVPLSSSLREPQGSWQSPPKRANEEIPTLANARSG